MQSTHPSKLRLSKQRVKTAKNRTNSSVAWLRRHINDPFVHLAKQGKYRSRAAFKLLEIEEKFNFIAHATSIVDLGSAPGGWLQIIKEKAKKGTKVLGIDLLDVEHIDDIILLKGDFTDKSIQNDILNLFDSAPIGLILSDMATNACGDRKIDHLRNTQIIEELLIFSQRYLKTGGNFVAKTIRGSEEQSLLNVAKAQFSKVKLFKPQASYSDSAEIYMIGINKK